MEIKSFQSLDGETWVLSEGYCVLGFFKSEAEAKARREEINRGREIVLVAMRLAEMTRMHPRQSNEHQCSKCGERVGIYPSGQAAIADNPRIKIICSRCAEAEPVAENEPAGSWDEIAQEAKDSYDVGKA